MQHFPEKQSCSKDHGFVVHKSRYSNNSLQLVCMVAFSAFFVSVISTAATVL
jgi:hypothetical protein